MHQATWTTQLEQIKKHAGNNWSTPPQKNVKVLKKHQKQLSQPNENEQAPKNMLLAILPTFQAILPELGSTLEKALEALLSFSRVWRDYSALALHSLTKIGVAFGLLRTCLVILHDFALSLVLLEAFRRDFVCFWKGNPSSWGDVFDFFCLSLRGISFVCLLVVHV